MRFRSLVAATAACLSLTTVPAPAGAAYADTIVITGSGTISPGLTVVPTSQSVSFTGTATTIGTHGTPGTHPCSFTGTFYASTGGGYGEMSGSCGPISFYVCIVVLVGPSIGFQCQSAPWVHVGLLQGAFTPSDVNPTTRYSLVASGAVAQGT